MEEDGGSCGGWKEGGGRKEGTEIQEELNEEKYLFSRTRHFLSLILFFFSLNSSFFLREGGRRKRILFQVLR